MDWTQTLTTILSIVGMAWYLHREHREDMTKMDAKIDKMDSQHREDMKLHREDMAKSDDKWSRLFEKFHMLDKDVTELKAKSSKE